ncbi:MAG: [protein-PII] uridylyltransferase [Robiginitomaculum sp.]
MSRHELYEDLKALKGEASRAEILASLKREQSTREKQICQDFKAGRTSGIKTAKLISGLYDDIVIALFDYARKDLFPSDTETLTLCAVGGYGRGEMAPYSDLDLLFLHTGKETKRDKQIIEYILYVLWDMRIKIGHASRTPMQSIALGRKDETVLTAMLDLRLLSGSEDIATNLNALLAKERTRAKKQAFIAAKLAARDKRHSAEGNSRYVIEPNVKEGKGGLRDLHVLYWIARFVYGGNRKGAPRKPHKVEAYVGLGLFDKKAAVRYKKAGEFLWQVRIHLHNISGRATEVLSFDKQAELAQCMGYEGESADIAITDFMHTYFRTAREVGTLTRIACAKLESQSKLLLPQGMFNFLPVVRTGVKQRGLKIEGGRLNFTSAAQVKKKPILMLHLFREVGARNMDIHPDALLAVRANLYRIDESFKSASENAQVFFDILLKSKAPAALLRVMNEAGVLGAYLPEFGSIVGRTQFNMHHAFTVDDHSLYLVEYLHDIERHKCVREHPLTTNFIKNWDTRLRRMVYLACLLHDVGKGKGDQCIEGARLAITACRRLGLPESDVETVSWLVRNHLEISETAQRRDISDPALIENFAQKMGSITRLQMLCALTVVDIRAVGPGIWNDWKGELIRNLYVATSQALMDDIEQSETTPQTVDFSELPKEVRDKPHFVTAKRMLKKDITELWVLTQDREKLFADLCGAITSRGANVIGAQLSTAKNGRVFNKFYLQNSEGFAFGRKSNARIKGLEDITLKAACGDIKVFTPWQNIRSPRAEAIPICVRAALIERTDIETIIEVEGRDRPGLLLDLAQIFAAHKLSVRSAHIDVAGPKAVDVFYVTHEKGINLKDTNLNDELLSVLKARGRIAT